jgi:hypothetical protein
MTAATKDGPATADGDSVPIGPTDRTAAWTWFTDERAIVDGDVGGGPRVLVGCVTSGDARGGDVGVRWRDFGAGTTGSCTLHERFEQDDHDCPALFLRPDGRYLAVYAKHGTDALTRWRVSSAPHDPTAWEPERTLDNGAETTYANVYRLPDDGATGRTYCFTRTTNWDPNVLVSTDQGSSWSHGGRLLRRGDGGQRPYVRYASDGAAIHLTTTDEHPRAFENGLYHGYVRDGRLFDTSGTVRHEDVLDGDAAAPTPDDLTTVFEPRTTIDGTELTRAWSVDVAVGADGTPVTVFQARAGDDPDDHRYLYARHDGGTWSVAQVAQAGPGFYEPEKDYTGLATLDPTDPSRLVVSTPIDPRDATALDRYALFAGATPDGGATWEWTPIDPDATTDDRRPLVAADDAGRTAIVWMRGAYETYRSWETTAVGRRW